MSKTFIEGIKTPVARSVSSYSVNTKDGPKTYNYLPWALSLALADRPPQEVVEHDGAMYVPVFGGCVVGIRQKIGGTGRDQVTWLPVLNGSNQAMPEARVTARDLGDTINRCRAKAAAMVNGVGLSLYSKGEANTVTFIKSLNVVPDTDLARATPPISSSEEKNGDFIDWPHALAAARLTDPEFHWEVVFKDVIDKTTGEVSSRPYFRFGIGYGVAVRVTYKGITHTELLPIMGFAIVKLKSGEEKRLDHQPLPNPDCHDWNRTVMRCLTKAISVSSGYGLNVYAKADVDELNVEPLQRKEAAAEPEAPVDDAVMKGALISDVEKALAASGRTAGDMLAWLGYKDSNNDLNVVSVPDLQKALQALSRPKAAAA